ncbi:hypothetical protein GCM10022219_16760 [Microbacterium oryzae]|nr:thiocillin family RiPP [Microbacterium oryzae]
MTDMNRDDLTAQDLDGDFGIDELDAQTALGTWGSAGTFSSASCPASTASSGGSASSFG